MNQMRRILCVAVILITVAATMGFTGGQQEEVAKVPTIGYIQAGPSVYYQLSADGVKAAAESIGYKAVILNSEDSPQLELSNIEDFIVRNVDAIILFTLNGDTAQTAAQLCNEAGVPLFIIGSAASDGPGKVTSTIKGNFNSAGKSIGSYIADKHAGKTLALVEGQYGANIAEQFTQGIEEKIAGANIRVVAKQPVDGWTRIGALEVTQNIITANPDLEVLFVNNEDMCAGAVQALEEAGLVGKVAVITHNGMEVGEQLLREGKIEATNANSPTMESGVAVKAVYDYLNGVEISSQIETPTKMITIENIDEMYGWDVDAAVRMINQLMN